MRRLIFPLLSSTAFVVAVAVVSAQNGAVTVTVDAAASKHAINPNVYGVAYATTTQLADLNVPVNRYGGNNTSRYNWQLNADNRGQDWYFESIGDSSSTAGQRGDDFVTTTRAGHAEPMITIPIVDYIATLGSNRSKLASYSIAKYGAQTGNDSQWYADAGNGVRASDGVNITWNTPTDANVQQQPDSTGLDRPSGHAVGTRRQRRGALLHPRQRAVPLAFDPSRRPSHGRRHGRDARQVPDVRARGEERGSRRAGGRR